MIETRALNAQFIERQQNGLHVTRDFGPRGIFQPRLQRADQRRRNRARLARLPCHADGIERKFARRRFRDGYGYRLTRGDSTQPFVERGGCFKRLVIARARIFAGAQFLQQAVELQLLVYLLQRVRIGLPSPHGFQLKLDGHGRVDGGKALAHHDALDIILEALAIHFAFDFAGALDGRLYRTKALDQLAGALVADARRARDVVDGVAFQGEQVGHLRRRYAEKFLDLFRPVPLIVLGGIQHGDLLADDLHHVFIAGDDDHLHASLLRPAGDGSNYIVGLAARIFEDGNPHGFQDAADVRDLLA